MTATDRMIELDVTGIAHGGVFVARHEGRVVFVSDAIPGERVRAVLDEAATGAGAADRRFWRAETVEVLEASAHRRPHIWPEAALSRDPAERPGGADLGHIDIDHQRILKGQVLAEALDRFAGGGIDTPAVEAVPADDEGPDLHWRTRVTLHVDGEGRIGPFAARSHRVIPVEDHPLARPAVAEAARSLTGLRPGRVDLVEPADGRVRILERPEPVRPARGTARGKGRRSRTAPRPPRAAREVVHERAAGREFAVDADGFWQVHPRAAETLDAAVAELLAPHLDPDAAHLDLYGGVGLFSATLARLGARRITSVESDARATGHARENLRDEQVDAVTARVDRYLGALSAAEEARMFRGGAVVLDPPRAGAGRAVVEDLVALEPAAIAYVACDPVALSRDLGTFRARGWEPSALRAFDLFPYSHHMETVALLTR
ncbi:TRAM domain-containing protein [Microbacterium pseudoresistens]|uniref:tRNA/tmRNA/rRNA uracil-C5-methylase (TrmA/RlmC/RlmD family) n=1 Tax=Microbacterium pseudoresistens TaxID=640634 RepID=A0A7Y9JN04_9MICO|nr:methyltransferase [Microbacterium pseudoresistens]NYD54910.1 tRNA/tmRNA/rRNA uracil-C5-methylase (TrmA/RlmC/RlmD family) [Microbacterium pseudoresistens]